jgi:hypothetical protein
MTKKIFILTVPGIGTQKEGYSQKFEEDLNRFSKNTVLAFNFQVIESRPFDATKVDEHQAELFDRLDAVNNLGGILSFRKFVLSAFGDGVTFERNSGDPEGPYQKIHRYLKDKIEEINELMLNYDKTSLVIVASSMGAHLVSSYIWDADNGKGIFETQPATLYNNLENLRYFVTIGCNIPLFISGYPKEQIIAIRKRSEDFEWDNYFDKDDVLGWPLEQLSDSYGQLVKDHQINTGLYVGAHQKYWDDNSFTRPFTSKLLNLYQTM